MAKKREKARYFFLKGAESDARGLDDQAFEFYKKAYEIDPHYSDASFAYGFSRLALNEDTFMTFSERKRNLNFMKSLIEEYPADIEAGEKYAYASILADTLPEAIRVYNILLLEKPGLSNIYYPLAYAYSQGNEIENAVKSIREYERLEGATSETMLRKISFWLMKEDTISALAEASAYAESNPGVPEPMVDKAMVYNLLGRQDSAIIFLEDALRQFPDKSGLKFDIALLYAERGDSDRFHTLVDEAFHGEDLEYEDRMDILNVYTRKLPFGAADYKESDALYDYASKLYPEDADFFDQYADYEATKSNYKGAMEKELRALALNPSDPSFLGRAITFSIVADNPKAGMKAFEDFPDTKARLSFPLLMVYVSAAQMSEDYNKAIQWVDTILNNSAPGLSLSDVIYENQIDSLTTLYGIMGVNNSATAYEVAGDIYAKTGKVDDAIRSYENSVTLSPGNNASAMNNYAYYLVETVKVAPATEQFVKAKEMSRKSLEQSGQFPEANYLDTYAWILFKEGNYKEALQYIEMAIEATEKNEIHSDVLSHYGDILFMNGNPEKALEQWEKALKMEPKNELLKKKVDHKTFFYE